MAPRATPGAVDNAIEITTFQRMAASPAPLPTIDLEGSAAFFQGPFQQSAAWVQQKREEMQQILEMHDRQLDAHELVTSEFVDNLSALLSPSKPVDIENSIDMLEESEDKLRRDLARLIKLAEQKMRGAAGEPELIVLINEAIKGFSNRYRRFAAMLRDARWNLMANRASKQPSAGVGPVHGRGEPPDHPEPA